MNIEQLEFDFQPKTPSDPERDLTVQVTIEIPFFGKKHQAHEFVVDRLDRILKSGVTERVRIERFSIS